MRCYIPSTQDNHTNIATQILCTFCALQQLCGGATLNSEGSIVSLTLNINFEDDTSLIHDNISLLKLAPTFSSDSSLSYFYFDLPGVK